MVGRTVGCQCRLFLAALGPVATAHTDGYGSSYSVIAVDPDAAVIGQVALWPLSTSALPQEPNPDVVAGFNPDVREFASTNARIPGPLAAKPPPG